MEIGMSLILLDKNVKIYGLIIQNRYGKEAGWFRDLPGRTRIGKGENFMFPRQPLFKKIVAQVFALSPVRPRNGIFAVLAFSVVMLYLSVILFASSPAEAGSPLDSQGVEGITFSVPMTTTTPTASVTPTSTITATVTPTPTVTITVTATVTPTPTLTSTPTPPNLSSFLPAISNPFPTPTPTITPSPTPSPTPGLQGIYGYVTFNGAPAGGIPLVLRFYNGSSWSTYASVITDANGFYSILNVPGLNTGQAYYIRYLNDTDPTKLFTWHTDVIQSYPAGSAKQLETFEIGNLHLIAPEPGAQIPLPYTFQWIVRAASPTDNYEFDLFDPDDFDPYVYTYPALGYTSGYYLSGLPAGFTTNYWYGWDIWILTPSGDPIDGYGISFYFYYVMFTSGGQFNAVQVPHSGPRWADEVSTSPLDLPAAYPNSRMNK